MEPGSSFRFSVNDLLGRCTLDTLLRRYCMARTVFKPIGTTAARCIRASPPAVARPCWVRPDGARCCPSRHGRCSRSVGICTTTPLTASQAALQDLVWLRTRRVSDRAGLSNLVAELEPGKACRLASLHLQAIDHQHAAALNQSLKPAAAEELRRLPYLGRHCQPNCRHARVELPRPARHGSFLCSASLLAPTRAGSTPDDSLCIVSTARHRTCCLSIAAFAAERWNAPREPSTSGCGHPARNPNWRGWP